MTTEELRLEYLKIREWGICDQRNLTAARFDAVVLEKLGTADADPAQWVVQTHADRLRNDAYDRLNFNSR